MAYVDREKQRRAWREAQRRRRARLRREKERAAEREAEAAEAGDQHDAPAPGAGSPEALQARAIARQAELLEQRRQAGPASAAASAPASIVPPAPPSPPPPSSPPAPAPRADHVARAGAGPPKSRGYETMTGAELAEYVGKPLNRIVPSRFGLGLVASKPFTLLYPRR